MKQLIKKVTPRFMLSGYYFTLAFLGAMFYGFPSKETIVIGVSGTNGKSTVVNLIERILSEAGHKTGLISTYNIKIAGKEEYNKTKLTMPGRFFLQKKIREATKAGCKFVVVETSSEGILQSRHRFIHFDIAVFTNLTPEHIERHGSFENYKNAKLKLFQYLEKLSYKYIDGKKIKKLIVANGDDKHSDEFVNFNVDKKLRFSLAKNAEMVASNIQTNSEGSNFLVSEIQFKIALLGQKNISNCLAAISVANSLGVSLEVCSKSLSKVKGIPGRMEWIDEGQNFRVMIDYAPEPYSMKFLYETVKIFEKNKIIHVFGSAGGGRDKSRRPVLGKLVGESADIAIVTNEDPYDESPQEIIDQVAKGVEQVGKKEGENLFKILDRKEAIKKALSLAKEKDLVLITGKGSEQYMVVGNGKKIPWDDRVVVREEIKKI
ncbi:MAG: UDP-N-acetylmuramoyl-L-alanyl-D-glutamate--2,6-diaminopimelate ligase [Candidatus Doudnabacteria bacterium CG10_big_fil_rev_8_21_14_0_10_41_10]|uniref:UDP-N-acetylmuramoyl-L-alanyl-D-glutamate--2, 6-diaminopimelate ligase n=1 Tax=Candidatus Doudnabacteria bacterium CG10_big_fil_rev_8_21_14_0_10_41_10 TaxID=1974551 RepID=A0A2H0VDX7_9BACT|nr:MAG: UDP-N-acetylmuramoyl-L-alanyl-D-glutamate--2,6-diaminopimelate ligase [Candidatus Doudnabacteria bacterium CG10_big_fil_rev_8_21_14_0_10_41_10]